VFVLPNFRSKVFARIVEISLKGVEGEDHRYQVIVKHSNRIGVAVVYLA
jgi:hypothetical protein